MGATLSLFTHTRRNANRMHPQPGISSDWERLRGFLQDREWQVADRVGGFEQGAGHVQATAAIGTGAGAHRQFGHAPAAGFGRVADVVIGNPIADADVHGGRTGQAAGLAAGVIPP